MSCLGGPLVHGYALREVRKVENNNIKIRLVPEVLAKSGVRRIFVGTLQASTEYFVSIIALQAT